MGICLWCFMRHQLPNGSRFLMAMVIQPFLYQRRLLPNPLGPIRLLCWNCRGLGNPCTFRELLLLNKEKVPPVLFLSETRLDIDGVEFLHVKLKFSGAFLCTTSAYKWWFSFVVVGPSGFDYIHGLTEPH